METTNLKESIEEIGQLYVSELTNRLLSLDKVATGDLINSLDYKVVNTINGIYLEIIAKNYLINVDQGRKPGSFVPIQPILRWINNKGIRFNNKTSLQSAYAISNSIKKNGIKATNVLKLTQDSLYSNIETILSSALILDIDDFINNIVTEK